MFDFLIVYLIKMNLAIERIWLSKIQTDFVFSKNQVKFLRNDTHFYK